MINNYLTLCGEFLNRLDITLSCLNIQVMMSLDTYTDKQLIGLIAQANELAFTVMYHRYYEVLSRSAYKRLQNEDVVEELVQDVFLNLWNKAAQLDPEGNLKSYFFATLRNKVLHELRASMVIAKHAKLIYQQPGYFAEDAHSLLHSKHLEQKFQSVVNDLPPQCREAFTLSRFENLSYKSIAERMDISVNTVEKHIGKALHILRRAFKEYDITLLIFLSWFLFN